MKAQYKWGLYGGITLITLAVLAGILIFNPYNWHPFAKTFNQLQVKKILEQGNTYQAVQNYTQQPITLPANGHPLIIRTPESNTLLKVEKNNSVVSGSNQKKTIQQSPKPKVSIIGDDINGSEKTQQPPTITRIGD